MPPRRKNKTFCQQCGKELLLNRKRRRYNGKFCDKKCLLENQKINIREKHQSWLGGKFKDKSGYVMIYNPTHPNCGQNGYIHEARILIEGVIGRRLKSKEHVHHKNGVKDDNRLENLELLSANKHASIHFSKPRLRRRKYETFDELPEKVIVGKFITIIPDDYRTYIGRECKHCKKLSWTRKYPASKFCKAKCAIEYKKENKL